MGTIKELSNIKAQLIEDRCKYLRIPNTTTLVTTSEGNEEHYHALETAKEIRVITFEPIKTEVVTCSKNMTVSINTSFHHY